MTEEWLRTKADPDALARHRERSRLSSAKWYQSRTAEQKREIQRKKTERRHALGRDRARAQRRREVLAKYGLTVSEYDAMRKAQGFKCLICGTPEDSLPSVGFHVDHCHATGVVRGLLCMDCNTGLGKFRDSLALLDTARDYLARWV